jgi:hypothetical protein
MPDNDPTQNPRDSGPKAAHHADVDSLLNEASQLAADLGGQLGTGRSSTGSSRPNQPGGPDNISSGSALEAQLDELDNLLGQTEAEIGTVSQPEEGTTAEDGTTAEAEPLPAPEPDAEAPDPAPAERDRASEGREESAREPSRPEDSPPGAAAPSGQGEPSERSGDAGDTSTDGTSARSDPAGAASAEPTAGPHGLVQRAQEALCTTLDLIDRPFARVSYRVRQVLGLCAIATFLVAVATIIISRIY